MTTPFYAGTADFAGADPGVTASWPTVPGRFFLGKPQTMMVELPSPMAAGYVASWSQGEVEHGLMGGGSAVTRLGTAMRRWTLPFQFLAGRDLQVLAAFYRRLPPIGPGPWCYVGPEDVNRLTATQSMCGALSGTASGWLQNGTSLAYESADTAPIFGAGVMQWVTGASGKLLIAGADGGTLGTPDTSHSAPYLPGMPAAWSVQAKLTTGTGSLEARLSGRNADGTVVLESTSAAVALSTSAWTQVSVSIAAGALGASQYLLPELVAQGANTILLSAPQLEYNAAPSDWGVGAGVPRVIWPTPLGDRQLDVFRTSAVTITLAESIAGAAL